MLKQLCWSQHIKHIYCSCCFAVLPNKVFKYKPLRSGLCDGVNSRTITSTCFYSWGHGIASQTEFLHLGFLHLFKIITSFIKLGTGTWEPKARTSQQVLMVQIYNETLLKPLFQRADIIEWTHYYNKSDSDNQRGVAGAVCLSAFNCCKAAVSRISAVVAHVDERRAVAFEGADVWGSSIFHSLPYNCFRHLCVELYSVKSHDVCDHQETHNTCSYCHTPLRKSEHQTWISLWWHSNFQEGITGNGAFSRSLLFNVGQSPLPPPVAVLTN